MANQVLAQMTLPEYTLGQSQFKPIVYEGVKDDNKLLAQSLAQLEGRMNKAQETKTQIDTELSKIESQIHDDPETKSWFAEVKQETQDKIQGLIDSGNFGEAIRTATDLGGTILKRSDIQGKIKDQLQWNNAVELQKQRNASGELDDDDFDYWLDNAGKYRSEFITKNGQIIGVKDQIYNNPTKSIRYSDIAQIAFKLNSPQGYSTKKSGGHQTINADGSGNSGDWHKSSSNRHVYAKDIRAVADKLIQEAGGINSVIQDFKSKKAALRKKEDKLKSLDPNSIEYKELAGEIAWRKEVLYDGDGNEITSPKEYFIKQTQTAIDRLAYDITETDDGSTHGEKASNNVYDYTNNGYGFNIYNHHNHGGDTGSGQPAPLTKGESGSGGAGIQEAEDDMLEFFLDNN